MIGANKYNVTLQATVNVRVPAVEAATPQEAISAALARIDLYSLLERQEPAPRVDFTEYAEEVREALVDEVGDEEYEKSRWFVWHNGQWAPAPADRKQELQMLDHQANVPSTLILRVPWLLCSAATWSQTPRPKHTHPQFRS